MTMRNNVLAGIAARELGSTPNITFEPPTPCLMISPMTANQGLRGRDNRDEVGIHTSFSGINSLTNGESPNPSSYSTVNDDIFAWQESVQSLSPAPSRPASVSSWSFCGSSISGGDDSPPLEVGDDRSSPSGTATTSLSVSPSQSGKSKVSHARKRAPGHVSRPRNAFILFRSHAINNNLIPTSLGVKDARAVSCIVASLWNSLPEEDKKEWRAVAQREKIEHQLKYPDYRFKPDTNLAANFKPRQHAKTEEAVKEQCGIIADQILRAHGRTSSAKSDCGVATSTKKVKRAAATPRTRKAPARSASRALLTVPTAEKEEYYDNADDNASTTSNTQKRPLRRHISAPQLGDHQEAPPMYTEEDVKMPQDHHYNTWQQPLNEGVDILVSDYRCASPVSYISTNEVISTKLEALDMEAVNEVPFIESNQDSISPEDVLARMYSDSMPNISDHPTHQLTSHDTLLISPMSTSFQDVDGGITTWQNWSQSNEEDATRNLQEMEYHRPRQDTSSSSLDGAVAISSLVANPNFDRMDPMLSGSTRLFAGDHYSYTNEKMMNHQPLRQVQTFQNLYELAQKDQIRNYQIELQHEQQHERHWSEDSNLNQTLTIYNEEDEVVHSAQMEANLASWVNDSM